MCPAAARAVPKPGHVLAMPDPVSAGRQSAFCQSPHGQELPQRPPIIWQNIWAQADLSCSQVALGPRLPEAKPSPRACACACACGYARRTQALLAHRPARAREASRRTGTGRRTVRLGDVAQARGCRFSSLHGCAHRSSRSALPALRGQACRRPATTNGH